MTRLNADTGASPRDRDHPTSHNGSRPPERFVLDRAEQLAHTGSWDWNLETDRLLWSDNMFRLLGLEPEEITPTPDYVVGRICPGDRARVEQELEAARAVGILPDVTYRITMPDGGVRSLRSFAAVADQAEGRPSRLIGSVQDVTELVEAMRQSEESLTLIETLQSTAPVGFAFVDRDFPDSAHQPGPCRRERFCARGSARPHRRRGRPGCLVADGAGLPQCARHR